MIIRYLYSLLLRYSARNKTPDHLFSDFPEAAQVDWFPLHFGGHIVKTHTLNHNYTGGFNFKPNGLKGAGHLFVAGLAGFFLLGMYEEALKTYQETESFYKDSMDLLGPLIIIDLMIAQLITAHKVMSPITVNRDFIRFGFQSLPSSSVKAIQILNEAVSTNDDMFDSYELNLVMLNNKRVNLLDHADYEDIIKSSSAMAQLLNVKVWDGVNPERRPGRKLCTEKQWERTRQELSEVNWMRVLLLLVLVLSVFIAIILASIYT